MGFDEAIKRIKEGKCMTRNGWNGKGQFITLASNITYSRNGLECIPYHRDMGKQAIVFVGTRGEQIGWLASQADMLAEDWEEMEA